MDTSEVKVEIDGRVIYGDRFTGWGLIDLPGWESSAPGRDNSSSIPGGDGLFSFGYPTVDGLRFTIVGELVTTSPQQAVIARSWIYSLTKLDTLPVRILEGSLWQHLRGAQIDGAPTAVIDHQFGGRRVRFEIPVKTSDPRKYGTTRSIEMDAAVEPSGGARFPMIDGAVSFGAAGSVLFPGVFALQNLGTAEFFPERIIVNGEVSSFTIQSESHVIEYAAPVPRGQRLIITPYAGGRATLDGADVSHNLLQADWVPVSPGQTRGFLFTSVDPQPGSKLTIDYPEGAWL